MAQRSIFADDLTNREIDGVRYVARVGLELYKVADDGTLSESPEEFSANWDADGNTAEAVKALIGYADLVTFILRMRNLVSLAADPEVVRKWALEQVADDGSKKYPTLKDRGRVPADILADYRREVVAKTATAGDAK